MCGIFGYIGNKSNASRVVFEGLKNLEYRGYDSWGIAAQYNGKLILGKKIGKIGNATLNPDLIGVNSKLAIGHTRWATHGGVTDTNAHPHLDCTGQIAVLHNGIVENFQELKNDLLKKGHRFISDTDTEVIAHLLEDNWRGGERRERTERSEGARLLDRRGRDPSSARRRRFEEASPLVGERSERGRRTGQTRDRTPTFAIAVKNTFNQLKGLNAVVAINTKNSQIIAAKNGSPLIVGIGNNEYFLASDVAAIIPHTKKVIFLKDNELISLNRDYKLYSLSAGEAGLPKGREIKPQIETINWKVEQASIGAFAHFMLKEIHEQPAVIHMLASTYTDQINKLSKIIKKARGTFFIGCGTAYHACLAGTYLFSKVAHRHVNTAPASEFNYLEDFLTKESLIIPLSQSGETIDVIEPLNHARQIGSQIISVTNVPGSTIYRMGDHKLLLGAGPEKAVASTKAYIAKISVLSMLAFAITDKLNEAKKILLESGKEVSRLLNKKSVAKIKSIANLLSLKEHIYIIGRGVSYATALEGALKIKEVSYIHTEGLAGGELKHGAIALISKGVPCIVIAPLDDSYDAIISNAIEIKSRGGYIIGISSKNNPAFHEWIEVRETGSPLLTQIVPLQLLAYYIAIKKHLDPDKPRNLAKSVTVK